MKTVREERAVTCWNAYIGNHHIANVFEQRGRWYFHMAGEGIRLGLNLHCDRNGYDSHDAARDEIATQCTHAMGGIV